MNDLIAFLRARLDEDEAAARRVDGAWQEEPESIGVILVNGEPLIEGHITGLTAHIARHDPARVRREVAAKRAIVAEHQDSNPPNLGPVRVLAYCLTCDDLAPCPTLCALAAVYSDHPDYRQEWKP